MKILVYVAGVELLKKFRETFANVDRERQELANAEKLFGLNITMYPEMIEMEKELKGLELIFSIYEKQKVSKKPYKSHRSQFMFRTCWLIERSRNHKIESVYSSNPLKQFKRFLEFVDAILL